MPGIESRGDLVALYTAVAAGAFVLVVRFSTWPLPQLIAASMVVAIVGIPKGDDIAPQLDILYIITIACVSVAFALLHRKNLEGGDTMPLKTMSLAAMFFVVAFYGTGLDQVVSNMFYKTRYGGISICDRYSIFALGTDTSWKSLERAIEEDNLAKQKKAMGQLTALYHPLKCPLACKEQCNHTFQQIESIRQVLVDKE